MFVLEAFGPQKSLQIFDHFWIVLGAVLGPILGPILALLGAHVGPTSLQDVSWDALFVEKSDLLRKHCKTIVFFTLLVAQTINPTLFSRFRWPGL